MVTRIDSMIYHHHTVYEHGEPVGEIFVDGIGGECSLFAMLLPGCIKLRNNTADFTFGQSSNNRWIPLDERSLTGLQALINLWLKRRPQLEHYTPPPVPFYYFDERPDSDFMEEFEMKEPRDISKAARQLQQRYGIEQTAELYAHGKQIEELYRLPDGTTCTLKQDCLSISINGSAPLILDETDIQTLKEYVQVWKKHWRNQRQ